MNRSAAWRKLNARIRMRAAELGLDDDARRALQRRATGKESCGDMSAAELGRVLAAMDSGGAGGRDSLPAGKREAALSGKLRALWISGYHLGALRERSDSALAAWLRRQTGLAAAAWATSAQLVRAIEALQAWLAREAGVDWRPYIELGRDGREREIERPRARVLEAQWRRLHKLGCARLASDSALAAYACQHAGLGRADSHLALSPKQADALIVALGKRIREAQEAA